MKRVAHIAVDSSFGARRGTRIDNSGSDPPAISLVAA